MNKPLSNPAAAASVERLRASFAAGRTRPAAWRRGQLAALEAMLDDHEGDFATALKADLGKSATEAYVTEIEFLRGEARRARRHLARWMRPRRVPTPLFALPGRSRLVTEPLGVALIIAPWNYPLMLALSPLIGAIAAGNCAVLKSSEIAANTSAAIAKHLPDYLDADAFTVIEGGAETATALLAERWDKIFYTGNATVGRIVMTAAAKHLTPVTLELGGKSPCIVLDDARLDVAARRIVWGKFLNAGQTCVAPDYVLVERGKEAALLEALKRAVADFYGPDPAASDDFARIVNERHFKRLELLLQDGQAVTGGQSDAQSRYIAPTMLTNVAPDSTVMRDEIFGPILPVLPVNDLDEAIAFVTARPKPLALYLFTESRDAAARVIAETSAGGMAVNETVLHLAVPSLPFGGVGESGTGAYHGQFGFRAFSHEKAVLARWSRPDLMFRYPPMTRRKFGILKRFL
ncbi:MAG TPA: aldehyde dehydrogenase family protein [Alphaproteobacteria bacterium]|nr:aldehyde dehydrogenase family protein [Alphaproteobacteria bacterium]